MVDGIEELLDIHFDNHTVLLFSSDDFVHPANRLVSGTTASKAIAASMKHGFVDGFQDPSDQRLDDLILETSDRKRSFPTLGFRDHDFSRRAWSPPPTFYLIGEFCDIRFEIQLVITLRYMVDS